MDDTKNIMVFYLDAALHHWGKILLCLSTGILLGYTAYSIFPAEWESEAIVQTGKAGGSPVEGLQSTIERLGSPTFFEGMSQKGEFTNFRELLARRHGGKNMLRVQTVRGAGDLLLLKLRARTAESAKLKLDLIINELKSVHNKLGFSLLDILRTELANRQSLSNSLEQTATEIDKRIFGSGCFDKADTNISKCSVLLSIRTSAHRAVLDNTGSIFGMKTALSTPNTIPTNAIVGPTLPVKRISSSLLQMLMLGLLLGLASSVIWIAVLPDKNSK